MKALYTADWHLTSLPDDEYRWGVFDWLRAYATNEPLDCIWILGDLTDRKDEHPAELVLRLCDELSTLTDLCPVYIVKGNHDYVDASQPFFKFLDRHPGCRFFSRPAKLTLHGLRFRIMPHVRKWQSIYRHEDFSSYDRVLFHQALSGAVGSNGHEVGGMPRARFDSVRDDAYCIGGDIHKPQQVGRARYVGSPHPVHFGDDFTPGGILERDGKLKRLRRVTLRKAVLHLRDVDQLGESDLTEGDRVRVTVHLPRSEFVHWDEHKARLRDLAAARGLLLQGVRLAERQARRRLADDTPAPAAFNALQVLDRFMAARGLDKALASAGRTLLQETDVP